MCDTRTRALIQRRVHAFVAEESVFTAYDVAHALRRDGRIVRESDVRRIVQAMWTVGDFGPTYLRADVTFPRSEAPAAVFYPYNKTPWDHPLFQSEMQPRALPGSSGPAALYRLIVACGRAAQPITQPSPPCNVRLGRGLR